METAVYDPEQHDGLIWAGKSIIVADASLAQLDKAPDHIRLGLARLTLDKFLKVASLEDFSRGVGGVLIEMVDEKAVHDTVVGLARGIALLGLTSGQLEELGLPLKAQTEFYKMARNTKPKKR